MYSKSYRSHRLVRACHLYSNVLLKAPGCIPFILPKESLPPSSWRIYIQHRVNNWELSLTIHNDIPIKWSLDLACEFRYTEGWKWHGRYPPIPLGGSGTYRQPVVGNSRLRFLAIFDNATWSIFYLLARSKTENEFHLTVQLSAVETPDLKSIDVLYSANSQKILASELEKFEWTGSSDRRALYFGNRRVRTVVH